MDQARLIAAIDRQEIGDLIARWGQARDRADWDVLRDCFHPDGTIHIAWISGSGHEFVDKSANRLSEFGKGEYSKHVMSAPYVELNGARAVALTHVNHYARVIIDDIEFDWEFWGQFHDHLERREDDRWRILQRTMVYEMDRLDAIHGDAVPDSYFEGDDFTAYVPEIRFLSWRLGKKGIPAAKKILTVGSDEERSLHEDGTRWLAAG